MSGPVFNYASMRKKADGMIRKYSSGGGNAVLRRVGSPDRLCSCLVVQFGPMERVGKLINPVDRKAIVSALAPDGTELVPGPDHKVDRLVILKTPVASPPVEFETLKIVEPAGELAPDGSTVVYWSLSVRG